MMKKCCVQTHIVNGSNHSTMCTYLCIFKAILVHLTSSHRTDTLGRVSGRSFRMLVKARTSQVHNLQNIVCIGDTVDICKKIKPQVKGLQQPVQVE